MEGEHRLHDFDWKGRVLSTISPTVWFRQSCVNSRAGSDRDRTGNDRLSIASIATRNIVLGVPQYPFHIVKALALKPDGVMPSANR